MNLAAPVAKQKRLCMVARLPQKKPLFCNLEIAFFLAITGFFGQGCKVARVSLCAAFYKKSKTAM
jgi:hypothetical protein